MPQQRYLRKAPISEAIIDFRVKASPQVSSKSFLTLKERLATQFPTMEEQRHFQARFEVRDQEQMSTQQRQGFQGYRFKTADGKTLAQFRVDGFTVNRLHPYTRWEELFPQAMELWALYCGLARPVTVTRLALRYINRIQLARANADLDTYLRAAPKIPPEIPQTVGGFLSRVMIRDVEGKTAAHVVQALETNTQTGQPTVILDIDAFKTGQFPADDPAIPVIFDQLRTFKNLIFFNYLTEETLKEYE